jgi:hypothetical protein
MEEINVKNQLIVATLAGLIGLWGSGFAAEAISPGAQKLQRDILHQRLAQLSALAGESNALEPCINGEVSASGLYPSQAEEDAALVGSKRLGQALSGTVATTKH